MTLPSKFRKNRGQAIASFDFIELETGLGVTEFFGIASQITGPSVNHHLITSKAVFSQPSSTSTVINAELTINFDSANFNLPRTPKGTAYFSAGIGFGTDSISLKVQLKHVDSGASETNLTSEFQSFDVSSGTTDSDIVFLELPITTEKIIKKGEFLRLTVKLVPNGTVLIEVGHDPKNQNSEGGRIVPGTKHTTVMTLLMPFKIRGL